MSGHSHWAGIKRTKEANDVKRGKVFSKLLAAITAASRMEPNPDFNPRLRTAVEKAKANKVPADNIERAIKKASEPGAALEELLFEAYGPGGVPLLIEAVADNKNRAVAEIKTILNEHEGKWADAGSVRWAFDAPGGGETGWKPKFPQEVSPEDKEKLRALLSALLDNDSVQHVYSGANLES